MRGDLPEWAARLSAQLPCRTHEARTHYGIEHRGGDTTVHRDKKHSGGKNKRVVVVDGEKFPSVVECAAALGRDPGTIHRMLKDGRARYA